MLSAVEANRIANQYYTDHVNNVIEDLEQRIKRRANQGYKWVECNFDYYLDFYLPIEDLPKVLSELRDAGYDLKKDFASLLEGKKKYIIRW